MMFWWHILRMAKNKMIAILSFPRSGNHFVRYIVEFLTGRSTIGNNGSLNDLPDSPICRRKGPEFLKHVDFHNPVARKYHFADAKKLAKYGDIVKSTKLVLIMRHPLESFLSHRVDKFRAYMNSNRSFAGDVKKLATVDKKALLYNLNFYNNFEGPKICIWYEDLISDKPEKSIEKISSFCGGSEERLSEMSNNFEKYRLDSLKSPYRKPVSINRPNPEKFYSNKIKTQNLDNYQYLEEKFCELLEHPLLGEKYK